MRQAAAEGVTLFTHGFNSDVETWVTPMSDQIPGHPGFEGSAVTSYEIEVFEVSGGGHGYSVANRDGPLPDASDSGEIVVNLNWETIDGGASEASTIEVAEQAAAALLATDLLPELNGRPLVELPLHLAGHSRGSSVVSEIARLLGQHGIWVDHLTFWDPIPRTDWGDAVVEVFENVLFADNYYQRLSIISSLRGSAVTDAYNRKLLDLDGGYGWFLEHSDVHLWYHGTVDLSTPLTIDGATIDTDERNDWWTNDEASGAFTGFHFSRIGGGNRLSSATPAGAGTDEIRKGMNRLWDFGAGTGTNRSLIDAKTAQWPNLITVWRTASGPVTAGQSFDLALQHQSDGAPAADPLVTVFLDPDRNPWNGNETPLDAQAVIGSGSATVLTSVLTIPVGGALAGEFRVGVEISQGAARRYLYLTETLEVVAPLPAPFIIDSSAGFAGELFGFTVSGSPGQTVNVAASGDMSGWEVIATQTLSGTTWDFSDPDTGLYTRRFYQVSAE